MGQRKASSAVRKKKNEKRKNSDTTNNSEPTEFGIGSTIKNTNYLDTITKNITHITNHPTRKGVKMQAHHLISATAMKKLSHQVKKNIEYFNYNINNINNLVFLPSTLQGACHLGVQPHIGNHLIKTDSQIEKICEDDAKILDTYHDKVERMLLSMRPLTMSKCIGECSHAELMQLMEDVKKTLDKISHKILKAIQNKPDQAPLTKLYEYFQPGNPIGCAGVDSVNGHTIGKLNHHGSHHCSINRKHLKTQNLGQQSEMITFDSDGQYSLEVGK